MLDWESLFKRYVWDSRTTPYFIPVARLNRQQADSELLAYCIFIGILFSVVALGALSESAPHGRSPAMALYGFTVVCAALILHFTKSPAAGYYLAATPLAGMIYLFAFGRGPERESTDTIIVAIIVLALLVYSWRLINLVRAYPYLPEGEEEPPRRRLFK